MSDNIYQGKTRSGKTVILRYPLITDTEQLTNYINTLSLEKTYIRFQGEQHSVEAERAWIQEIINKISTGQGITLYAEIDNEVVGICDINLMNLVESHIGVFGLTIAKAHRDEGIGSLLMEKTLEHAIQKMPSMKIITLGVFANNPGAIHLYKKLGFTEYGNLPKGILHRGEFVDHIFMYKEVNSH